MIFEIFQKRDQDFRTGHLFPGLNFQVLKIVKGHPRSSLRRDKPFYKYELNLRAYKVLYFQSYILRHDANVESEIERLKVNELKIYLIRSINK